ncbi:MAG: DinB family protein [Planctomycetota bacterium]
MESFELSNIELSPEMLLSGRDHALEQLKWARQYTLQLVESVPEDRWYEMPAGVPSNLAWQVGHLAVSEYGLLLFRQRGRSPGDLEILPGWLRKQYGRSTMPKEKSEKSPSPAELLERLERIHQQAIAEVPTLTAETLAESIDMPYAAYPIKLGALMFCPIHETLHAGQIGVIRRALGYDPIR